MRGEDGLLEGKGGKMINGLTLFFRGRGDAIFAFPLLLCGKGNWLAEWGKRKRGEKKGLPPHLQGRNEEGARTNRVTVGPGIFEETFPK